MQVAGICNSARRSERLALVEWARERRRILGTQFIEQFRRVAEGAEHVVYYDESRGLAMKATHPNRFGHSARNGWVTCAFGVQKGFDGNFAPKSGLSFARIGW